MNTAKGSVHQRNTQERSETRSKVGVVCQTFALLVGFLLPNPSIGIPASIKSAPLQTIAPEFFDHQNYKQLTLPNNSVVILVPKDVTPQFEQKALRLLDHTFAHYPENMYSPIRLIVFQYDLRKGTYASKLDCSTLEKHMKTSEKLPDSCRVADGLSFSPWSVVHIRIPPGGDGLYLETESTLHHERFHMLSQNIRLNIHKRLLKEWEPLFREGRAPEDSSSGRTDQYGIAYARTGTKDDQAVLAEDLFNVRGIPGWSEIRQKEGESKIYQKKLELIKAVYYEASRGQMDASYWQLMEEKGAHTAESYRIFFRAQAQKMRETR